MAWDYEKHRAIAIPIPEDVIVSEALSSLIGV